MIAAHYRIACDPGQIAHDLGLGQRAATAEDLVRAARRVGLKSHLRTGQVPVRLESVPLPAILGLKGGRFAILTHRLADGRMRLVDPIERGQALENIDAVAARWSGEIVLITRRAGGPGVDPPKFDFRWFLPSLWRYRRALTHTFVASLFIQLFALVTPLFFQVIIDKVLLHKGMSTLVVVVIGLLLIGLFDVVPQYLRSYALSHTVSRIDVELGRPPVRPPAAAAALLLRDARSRPDRGPRARARDHPRVSHGPRSVIGDRPPVRDRRHCGDVSLLQDADADRSGLDPALPDHCLSDPPQPA
jgi:subfamily B ATP-binding cassette protein HlyB/CyaB